MEFVDLKKISFKKPANSPTTESYSVVLFPE